MGSKKGQLFLVSLVFLIGMIFVVQQALFQYSEIDMSRPYQVRDVEILGDMVEMVNSTIKETYMCNETRDNFEDRMEKMKMSLLGEFGRSYTTEMFYIIDCSNWDNVPPQEAPMKITIGITGFGKDTRGTFDFYHEE